MIRLATIFLAGILLGACTSEADPTSSPSPTEATSPNESPAGPVRYEASACPVADEAFCATATEVIEALQSADVGRLFALSQEEIRRISGGKPENFLLEITCRELFAYGDH